MASASISTKESFTEPDGTSVVTLKWEFKGGEIAEHKLRVRRRVWADDPNDLMSPMHYEIEVLDDDDHDDPLDGVSPAARSVYRVLEQQEEDKWLSVSKVFELVVEQKLAENSQPLQYETVRKMLPELKSAGLAEDKPGRLKNDGKRWRLVRDDEPGVG